MHPIKSPYTRQSFLNTVWRKANRLAVRKWRQGLDFSDSLDLSKEIEKYSNLTKSAKRSRLRKKYRKQMMDLRAVHFVYFVYGPY